MKTVIKDVNPEYATFSRNVESINPSYTSVADSDDISAAKRELRGVIDDSNKYLEKKINSLQNKIDKMGDLPNDIKNVIEATNNQQADLLRKVYREISENLSKQQKKIDESRAKATELMDGLFDEQKKMDLYIHLYIL